MTSPPLSLLPPTPGITSDHTSDVSSNASSTLPISITAASASAVAQPQPTLPCAAPADFSSNDYLSLNLPTPPRPRTRSTNHITGDPRFRWLATPRLQLRSRSAPVPRVCSARPQPSFSTRASMPTQASSRVPQPGVALLYDAAICASVHDGARASRVAPRFRRPFAHNDVLALRALRAESVALKEGLACCCRRERVKYGWNSCTAPTITTRIQSMEFLLSFQVSSSASVDGASGHFVCSLRCTFSLATNGRVVDEHTYLLNNAAMRTTNLLISQKNASILFNRYFSTFSRTAGPSRHVLPSSLRFPAVGPVKHT